MHDVIKVLVNCWWQEVAQVPVRAELGSFAAVGCRDALLGQRRRAGRGGEARIVEAVSPQQHQPHLRRLQKDPLEEIARPECFCQEVDVRRRCMHGVLACRKDNAGHARCDDGAVQRLDLGEQLQERFGHCGVDERENAARVQRSGGRREPEVQPLQ